jgi:hypothetical protein
MVRAARAVALVLFTALAPIPARATGGNTKLGQSATDALGDARPR